MAFQKRLNPSMGRFCSAPQRLLLLRRAEGPGQAIPGQPVKSYSLFTPGSTNFWKAIPRRFVNLLVGLPLVRTFGYLTEEAISLLQASPV